MRLTLHTDYALRMLMLLAVEDDRAHTIEQVSRRYGISRNHLMKVTQTLVQAGFVRSLRGRGGGLRLARDPAAITLAEVVRRTEDGFALVECFDPGRNRCVIARACGLQHPLQEALQAFLAVLDRYSLADLASHPLALNRLARLRTALEASARPSRG